MVFRRENKADSFQRQMSALRQQLGSPADAPPDNDVDDERPAHVPERRSAPPRQAEPTRSYSESSGFNFGGFGTHDPGNGMTPGDENGAELAIPQQVDEQTSVIANGTTWKGDLETNGSLHIHGKVEGTLTAKDTIYVADSADVDATLNADNVIIGGLVRGTIRCGSRFEILPQGRVSGDILAPAFAIHEGANVTGQFRMGTPDEGESAGPRPAAVVQRRANRNS